jgi:hypothetical protein
MLSRVRRSVNLRTQLSSGFISPAAGFVSNGTGDDLPSASLSSLSLTPCSAMATHLAVHQGVTLTLSNTAVQRAELLCEVTHRPIWVLDAMVMVSLPIWVQVAPSVER